MSTTLSIGPYLSDRRGYVGLLETFLWLPGKYALPDRSTDFKHCSPPSSLADYSYADYRRIFDVNVLGTLNVIAETAPTLRAAGGGAMANFASMDAFAVSRG